MPTAPSVTVADVRLELNEISESAVSDAVIEQKIEFATTKVEAVAYDGATTAAMKMAVVKLAACDVLTSGSGGYTRVAQELDTREEWDVKAMVDDLRTECDEVLSYVRGDHSGAQGASLHTLGGPSGTGGL